MAGPWELGTGIERWVTVKSIRCCALNHRTGPNKNESISYNNVHVEKDGYCKVMIDNSYDCTLP